MFNQNGMQVATVGEGDKIKLTQVSIYRDLGTKVDLDAGLQGGERIVLSPPATLQDGSKVKVMPQDQNGSGDTKQVSQK
jgi:HlyD family secretion protein